MSLVQADNVTLAHGRKTLFSELSVTVDAGDRIGLVGDNGCGKSSLLRALTGQVELDRGQVTTRRNLTFGYMPQEVDAEALETPVYEMLLQALPSNEQDQSAWKVDVALSELGIPADRWSDPMKTLSGGWRRLLLVARTNLADPEILILDEPTNHLDLGKIILLEDWLAENAKVPFIIVSHDRTFLDRCCNKTWFLRSDGLHVFATAFSQARAELLQGDANALRSNQQEEKQIRRLEAAAKRLRIWSNLKGINPKLAKRAKGVQSRADQLRDRQTETYKAARRDINLQSDGLAANIALRLENVTIEAPDGRKLFQVERLAIKRGERIALLGLNGTGKTQFIARLLRDFVAGDPGPEAEQRIVFNPQIKLGNLDQHLGDLPLGTSPHALLEACSSLGRSGIVRELHNIGLPINEQSKPIANLSFGERARLAFLIMNLERPNFFILDEPTNHLDIAGQERLEEILEADEHTCIFVSHDRRMVQSVPTRYLEIEGGRLVEADGPEDFFEKVRGNDGG